MSLPSSSNRPGTIDAWNVPSRVGKYELVRRLAVGGMAEVYLARVRGIEGFEKVVVIKRLLPQFASNPVRTKMFLDEARIAALLVHPNIVQTYEIGRIGSNYFFSMEFLHGHDTLAMLCETQRRKERPPLEHAVQIVLGACAGLHYAHERRGLDQQPLGLVHRDVSPQNLFVTYDGGVKLVDFGIAKALRRETETHGGTLKGKVRYMSPEQCRSEPVDRRSDIFSLGIVLWELTTGRKLFKGPNELHILKTVSETDAPSPRTLVPEYPEPLEQIVMRALARDREQRYPTAEAMYRELEAFGREARLDTSPFTLAAFMKRLFGEKAEGISPADEAEAFEAPDGASEWADERPASATIAESRWTRRRLALVGGAAALALVASIWILRRPHAPHETAAAPPVVTQAPVPAAPAEAPEPAPAPTPTAPTPKHRHAPAPKAAPQRQGWLSLGSSPQAVVSLGGKVLGATPLIVLVPAGHRTLTFRNREMGLYVDKAVDIPAGGSFRQTFTWARGTLIVSGPDGAQVIVDDKLIGRLPEVRAELFEGQHTLRVTGGGHTVSSSVRINAGQELRRKISF